MRSYLELRSALSRCGCAATALVWRRRELVHGVGTTWNNARVMVVLALATDVAAVVGRRHRLAALYPRHPRHQ